MKKVLLLTALMLVVSAPPASGWGVNLSWGDRCWGDAGSTNSLTWACDSNTYTGVRMTCSFQPSVDKTNFVAIDVLIEGIARNYVAPVPDWWKLGSGECRSNLITASIDASVLGGACVDPWQGSSVGLVESYSWEGSHIRVYGAGVRPDPVTIHAADETFGLQFRVAAGKTVGADACAGCGTPMMWFLSYVCVSYRNETSYELLDAPMPDGNQFLDWQRDAVPVRNTSWGRVKGLYR